MVQRKKRKKRKKGKLRKKMYRINTKTNQLEYKKNHVYNRVFNVEGKTLSRSFVTAFNQKNLPLPKVLQDRRFSSNQLRESHPVSHIYSLQNGILKSKITPFNDLAAEVENALSQRSARNENFLDAFEKPFNVTLKSVPISRVRRKFTFNNYYHFQNWFAAIRENRETGYKGQASKFTEEIKKKQNVFSNVYNVGATVKFVKGGKPTKAEHLAKARRSMKGLFYTFNVFNPYSTKNNCGIECLRLCRGMSETFSSIPAHNLRKSVGIKGNVKITPDDLKKIYEQHQTEGRVLCIINRDFCGIYNKDYNYLWISNGHYRVVESMEARDFRSKQERTIRGTLAFDFETRSLDKFDTVKSSGARAHHMCDTIIKFVFQRYKSKKIEKMGFTTNSKKTAARQFLDWLKEEHRKGKYFTCIAHNGANFDFYLLLKELTEEEIVHSVVNLRGTSIINMQYCKHAFKDPCCFMPATLDHLCKSFNIDDENKKLKRFEIPVENENGTEMTTLTNTEMCFYKPELNFEQFLKLEQSEKEYWRLYEKYCENDCTALLSIWFKFRKAYEDIVYELGGKTNTLLKQGCTLNSSNTIGSLSKRLLETLTKKSKARKLYEKFFKEEVGTVSNRNGADDMASCFPKYGFVTKFKRGGISHCHQNGRHDHQIASVDINSQYPASLLFMRIPAGESFWVTRYRPIYHGYYHLKNIIFNLPPNTFLPICGMPDKGKSLNWAETTEKNGKLMIKEAYIDSFMVDYLFENFRLEKFECVRGLVSKEFVRGHEIFGKYVKVLYKAKAEQDIFKDTGSSKYNPALRNCIKLFLNSLTGKLVESTERYFNIIYTCSPNSVESLDGTNRLNIKGVHFRKDRNNWKPNLWVGCGVMVYSYSKRLLFEYIRHIDGDIIHVETDGIYFDARKLPTFYEALQQYEQPIHLKDIFYPVGFGNELGNIKLEHISEGKKTYQIEEKNVFEKDQLVYGPWRAAYFNGKKNYFFHCSLDNFDVQKLKGFPSSTIDESGTKRKVIDMQLYTDVFNGKPVTKEFMGIRKVLHGDTRLLSMLNRRTVNPAKRRKVWL